jgi:hypothetical protein
MASMGIVIFWPFVILQKILSAAEVAKEIRELRQRLVQ